ncbi:sodium:solute symporter family protein [Sinanaerobacter chloroacetimidivorans]|uniref:Sodium:solute symporter family protein n=1 Tax=Sinanaerobacter chloroacetimidivorans TaxID=2818044 RepID=A0A8J7W2F8_9FIRM|nr:sodium:solute symporter family protein [Sinanaerobacter chloroacetimidivorans]MBR0598168.1 sodium:solute symporter family protein [Sinanaerobacter chloroacetimidivorans]
MNFESLEELFYSNIPIPIILIFTVIPLVIGSLASQNSISTINDFFIYNRNMGTMVSFFTVYATWWSSFAFLGSISYFYSVGSVYWTAIGWNVLFGLLYLLFGAKIAQYGKEKGYLTPISFFTDIYDSRKLSLLVTAIMIIFTIPYLQIQLYGGAIIIEIATKGVIPWQICALMFYVVMIIYLWAGGLRAVAWTDIFYGLLIFLGLIAGGYFLVSKVGGVDILFEDLITKRPDLILLPVGSDTAGVTMWISMFLIIPIGVVMGPQIWLRMYATKEAKTFYIMPLLLSLGTIAYVGSILAGSAAALLKPEGVQASADAILPILLVEFAPGWFMALIMCCGAAACLSTANSGIHAVSALLTLDIYKRYFRPKSSEKHIVFIAKLCIVVFSAAAYLALVFAESPISIVDMGFIALCGMSQLIVPVAGALLWEKSNAQGAAAGLMAGVFFTLYFSFMKTIDLPLHSGVIALMINGITFVICGLLLPHNPVTVAKITLYRKGNFQDVTSD